MSTTSKPTTNEDRPPRAPVTPPLGSPQHQHTDHNAHSTSSHTEVPPLESASKRTGRPQAERRRTAQSSQPYTTRVQSANGQRRAYSNASGRAASASPTARRDGAAFPGAKRLDEDSVPWASKLMIAVGVVTGVATAVVVLRAIRSYSAEVAAASSPTQVVIPSADPVPLLNKEEHILRSSEAASEIRDRIIGNMLRVQSHS